MFSLGCCHQRFCPLNITFSLCFPTSSVVQALLTNARALRIVNKVENRFFQGNMCFSKRNSKILPTNEMFPKFLTLIIYRFSTQFYESNGKCMFTHFQFLSIKLLWWQHTRCDNLMVRLLVMQCNWEIKCNILIFKKVETCINSCNWITNLLVFDVKLCGDGICKVNRVVQSLFRVNMPSSNIT